MSMKNILGICLLSMGLAACAGNPPAWWNPGNVYSPTHKEAPSTRTDTAPAEPAVTAQQQPPAEQILTLPDEDFEEMTLTPLQDEEGENDSGEASAQSAPNPEDSLPPPSILD